MEFKKCENPACENIVTEYTKKGKLKIYCSTKCNGKYNAIKSREKARLTYFNKTGYYTPSENPEVIKKIQDAIELKYGVRHALLCPELLEKAKHTCLINNGVEHPSQSSDILKKQQATLYANYGVLYPLQSITIKERSRNTNIETLGVEWPMQSETIRSRSIQSNFERYGSSHMKNSHISQEIQSLINDQLWLREQNETKTLFQIGDELGINPVILSRRFKQFNIPVKQHQRSYFEIQIYNFVKTFHNVVLPNDRIQIKPFELDIYLPDLNLAFECNGEPWHQDEQKEINKFNMCKEKGIDLHFIWYRDWKKDQEKMKKYITDLLTKK